jgi:MFS family permease
MQIPSGILADGWGPRRLLTAGALASAAGSLLFAASSAMAAACLGRLLIGAGVAVAFVASLKLAADWFPLRYYSMISGLVLFTGILGAVSAGVPLRLLVDAFGWRAVMVAAAALTAGFAAVTWRVVRNDPAECSYRSYATAQPAPEEAERPSAMAGVREVFCYRNTGLLFLAPAGVVGTMLTFCGLWGVPYLTTHYGLSTAEAAALTSLLMITWAGASPFFGWLSDRCGRRKPLLIAGQVLAAAGWAVILFVPGLPLPLLTAVAAATGLFSATFISIWPLAKETVPARLAGTITGVLNMGNMFGVTVLQPAVGWVLDRRWDGAVRDGVRVYSLEAYHAGFGLMMGWIVLGLLLFCLTRETYCRQSA